MDLDKIAYSTAFWRFCTVNVSNYSRLNTTNDKSREAAVFLSRRDNAKNKVKFLGSRSLHQVYSHINESIDVRATSLLISDTSQNALNHDKK